MQDQQYFTREQCQAKIQTKLAELTPVLASALVGDFSKNIPLPSQQNEFSEIFTGIHYLIEGLKEKTLEVKNSNVVLSKKIEEKTRMLNSKVELLKITEKKLTELSQRLTKENAFLLSIGDGILITDDTGIIQQVNEVALQHFGQTKRSIIGKSVFEILSFETLDGEKVPIQEAPTHVALKRKQKTGSNTYYCLRKDGTKFPCSVTASPTFLKNKLVGSTIVINDISKQLELDRMKSEFISLTSHQLRTPLSIMKWRIERLLGESSGSLSEKQLYAIHSVNQANERMIKLINALLNVSRIESSKLGIKYSTINLNELVKEVIEDCTSELQLKKHTLSFVPDNSLPTLVADSEIIKHIFTNLLLNSIGYTPEKGHITITLTQKEGKILSTIQDDGIGITQSEQRKLFGKFFRGEKAATLSPQGSGLGLYIVRALLTVLNGSIWYESAPNKGTTFHFALPLSSPAFKTSTSAVKHPPPTIERP